MQRRLFSLYTAPVLFLFRENIIVLEGCHELAEEKLEVVIKSV